MIIKEQPSFIAFSLTLQISSNLASNPFFPSSISNKLEMVFDLISDSFGFVGAESILYYLEGLNLDKIPEPKQTQEIS